jgi:hypothetical protein
MKNKPLRLAILVPLLLLTLSIGYAQVVKRFGAGLMATGTFVTTISKQPYQQPASVYFSAVSKSMTSSAESYLAQTVNSGSAATAMTGASGGTMQMLYVSSLSLDGTCTWYNNSAGTGSSTGTPIVITAGVPYEWDYLTSGVAAPFALSSTSSMIFTAGNTVSGGTTTNTSTALTAVGLYP